MVAVDRIQGLSGSLAVKAPCRAATTAATALSGEQTIDGVAVVEGDRVLVKDQASGVDNGVYNVSTGTWTRSLDFDGANDVTQGTLLTVNAGTISAGMIYKLTTADPITIGTTSLSFSGSGIAPTLPLAINQGGTGESTASDARNALGVEIGADVQPYDAATAKTNVVQSFSKAQIGTPVALSVAANAVAVDLSLGNNFTLTLQATTAQTLSNPTNAVAGQKGSIYITQNATPSTLAFGANWLNASATAADSVSTTAGARNVLSYDVFDSTHIYYTIAKHGVA